MGGVLVGFAITKLNCLGKLQKTQYIPFFYDTLLTAETQYRPSQIQYETLGRDHSHKSYSFLYHREG